MTVINGTLAFDVAGNRNEYKPCSTLYFSTEIE